MTDFVLATSIFITEQYPPPMPAKVMAPPTAGGSAPGGRPGQRSDGGGRRPVPTMSRDRRTPRRREPLTSSLVVLLACWSLGCTPGIGVDVSTAPAPGEARPISRLAVVLEGFDSVDLDRSVAAVFAAHGAEARVVATGRVDGSVLRRVATDADPPEAILVVQRIGGGSHTQYGTTYSWTYDADLYQTRSKKTLWRGGLTLGGGSTGPSAAARDVAEAIAASLVEHGLLRPAGAATGVAATGR